MKAWILGVILGVSLAFAYGKALAEHHPQRPYWDVWHLHQHPQHARHPRGITGSRDTKYAVPRKVGVRLRPALNDWVWTCSYLSPQSRAYPVGCRGPPVQRWTNSQIPLEKGVVPCNNSLHGNKQPSRKGNHALHASRPQARSTPVHSPHRALGTLLPQSPVLAGRLPQTEARMKALIIPVTGPLEEIELDGTLKQLQDAVGGFIEAVPLPSFIQGFERATAYVNEEGKYIGTPEEKFNGRATDFLVPGIGLFHGDYIAGTMVLCGFDPMTGEHDDLPEPVVKRARLIESEAA